MAFISITRLRLRSHRFVPPFAWYAIRSQMQALAADGCYRSEVTREYGLTFWTKTVWHNEAAMKAFMLTGPHRSSMSKLRAWCDEALVVHWIQPTEDAPSWQEGHRRMQTEGRPSKVNHPTPAHLAFQIPPPRF